MMLEFHKLPGDIFRNGNFNVLVSQNYLTFIPNSARQTQRIYLHK